MSSKQAPYPIDIIVIGAGVAGIATALRLRQAGHRVTVVDRGTGPRERKGGAHLPPNPTKLLCEWGFSKHLSKCALSIRSSEFMSFDDGHVIGALHWLEDVLFESGADYLLVQYRDLCQFLFDAAKNAGVIFEFQLTVTSVQSDPRRPRIILSNGRSMAAHLIIGADGPRSIVRESITGPIHETYEGHNLYVSSISRDQLKDDPELYDLTAYTPHNPNSLYSGQYKIWMGDNRCVLMLTTEQGKSCSIHAFLPEVEVEGRVTDDAARDGVLVPGTKLKVNCEPKLRRLLNRAPMYRRTRIYHREFAEDWADEYGRLIVMSESAYPIWPGHIHSCSMPIEDAGVLSTLFTYLKSEEQISYLARAFQEIREARVHSIFAKETKGFFTLWLPPGPARIARDEGLKMILLEGHKAWDETKLRWQFDEFCEIFAYHAREAAEDWWVMWGLLRERSQQMNGSR